MKYISQHLESINSCCSDVMICQVTSVGDISLTQELSEAFCTESDAVTDGF